jgi:hypothetical protein
MRVFNRLLAVLVSVAVIAAAAVLVTEVAAHRLGVRPVVFNWHATYRWAQRTTWNTAAVRAGCLLIAIVGLALLAAQLKPRRPARDHPPGSGSYVGHDRRRRGGSHREPRRDTPFPRQDQSRGSGRTTGYGGP